jgi:hypothetical protein
MFTTYLDESTAESEEETSTEVFNGIFSSTFTAPPPQAQRSLFGDVVTSPSTSGTYSASLPSVTGNVTSSPHNSSDNPINSPKQSFDALKPSNLSDYYKKLVSVI